MMVWKLCWWNLLWLVINAMTRSGKRDLMWKQNNNQWEDSKSLKSEIFFSPKPFRHSEKKCFTKSGWMSSMIWKLYMFCVSTLTSVCAPAVSSGDDQPHAEVGGCMEGAGLPGTQRFLRCARREWTLVKICPLGTTCGLLLFLPHSFTFFFFTHCSF